MKGRILQVFVVAWSTLLAQSAAADPFNQPALTVSDLYTPSLEPLENHGIPIGAFLLLPTISSQISYDDNVFAANRDRQDDFVLEVQPELRLLSNWTRHSLEFGAGARGLLYDDFSGENRADAYVGGKGIFEIHSDLKVRADASFRSAHEARGTGDSFLLFDEPLRYDQFNAGLSLWKQFNRLWTSFESSVQTMDFENPTIRGTIIDQDYRDETSVTYTNRTGYDVSPKTAIFAETRYRHSDYEQESFDGHGYRFLAGVQYELSRLIKSDLAVGYLHHDFDSASVADIDTWTYSAQLYWDPTPLLRLTAAGKREVGVSLLSGIATSRLSSEIGLKAQYEFKRNIMLTGILSYEWLEYEEAGYDDNVLSLSTTAEYFVDTHWSVFLRNNYSDYDHGLPGLGYQRNTTTLGARGRF